LRWRTRTAYEAALRTAFEQTLRTYLESRETAARNRGMTPRPEKRDPERHLAWLVRFQVGCQTYEEVARRPDGADRRNVQRDVKDMARLIGLTLRKKQGPKKRLRRP
jgi:hypothetical protein